MRHLLPLLLLLVAGALPARAAEPDAPEPPPPAEAARPFRGRDRLSLGVGELVGSQDSFGDSWRLDYVQGRRAWAGGHPTLGVVFGDRSFAFPYLGITWDSKVGRRLRLLPSFMVGAVDGGDPTRFASSVYFRTGLELAFELPRDQRIGLAYQHVSNSGIERPTGDANGLYLTYSIPLGR